MSVIGGTGTSLAPQSISIFPWSHRAARTVLLNSLLPS